MMEMETRKPNRLLSYDYNQNGAYFVTICTENRACILSRIVVGDGVLDVPQVQLSQSGKFVDMRIAEINRVYTHLSIDKYVIMPNHIHMLITVHDSGGTSRTPSPTNAEIPKLVSTFKRFVNKDCGINIFQRSYYDHIIRDEQDYLTRWNYIDENPAKWTEDAYYL